MEGNPQNLNTFRIDSEKHTAFLAQHRHDSVTAEPITAGDEVVFCKVCGSVFKTESWDYIGREHCGQKQTLERFPEISTAGLEIRTSPNELLLGQEPKKSKLEYAFALVPVGLLLTFFTDYGYGFGLSITLLSFMVSLFALISRKTGSPVRVYGQHLKISGTDIKFSEIKKIIIEDFLHINIHKNNHAGFYEGTEEVRDRTIEIRKTDGKVFRYNLSFLIPKQEDVHAFYRLLSESAGRLSVEVHTNDRDTLRQYDATLIKVIFYKQDDDQV